MTRADARGTAVFTLVEVAGLAIWFELLGRQSTFGAYVQGRSLGALGLLFLFLTVEHLLSYNVIRQRPLKDLGQPIGPIAAFSLLEALMWALWLVMAGIQPVAAAIQLAALLVVEHTLSDNVARGAGLFDKVAAKEVVVLSIIEAAGAALWLSLATAGRPVLGVAVLAVFSFGEHTLLVREGRR